MRTTQLLSSFVKNVFYTALFSLFQMLPTSPTKVLYIHPGEQCKSTSKGHPTVTKYIKGTATLTLVQLFHSVLLVCILSVCLLLENINKRPGRGGFTNGTISIFFAILNNKKICILLLCEREITHWNTYMSHFAYACKMLNLVLENSEYLWFY